MPAPSLSVQEFNELTRLANLREDWNQLLQRTESGQFFQSYDWLSVYWAHYGHDQRLKVLVVRDGPRVIGIVPLVIRRERRQVGTLSVLTYPLDDWGSFYHPITDDATTTVNAVVNYLSNCQSDWDILSWRWCDSEHSATTALRSAMASSGLPTQATVRETSGIIDLPDSFDQYLASRSGKFRNNVKRWTRRAESLGALRYEKYRPSASEDADPRWDLFDRCVELAAKSWQGSSETGTTLSHASILPFLRDVHQAAARLGSLDLNLMYLDDQPVAFEYGYWWQGYKYSLRFGYDSDATSGGFGNLMWLKTIEESIARGDRTFDMGVGSLDYKKYYCTRTSDCVTLDHFRRTAPRAQLIALKQQFASWWHSIPSDSTCP